VSTLFTLLMSAAHARALFCWVVEDIMLVNTVTTATLRKYCLHRSPAFRHLG
jgi:hypothetical protein